MKRPANPFLIKGYHSPALFCNRDAELETLYQNVMNEQDTTLVSARRMGKTGLILRFFDELRTRNPEILCLYIDIFSSRSLDDFIRLLAESLMKKFPEKSGPGKKFMVFLRGLRPLIAYDALTGEPRLEVRYQSPAEKEYTLKGLMDFVESQGQKTVIALDEFQQITEYPETHTEALLRSCIQQLRNVHFIFCGSKQSILREIFSEAKRPFFASTRFLHIQEIDKASYAPFIADRFADYGKKADEAAIEYILEWSMQHTFYTQSLCSEVFSSCRKQADTGTVKKACYNILRESETVFWQYRGMLTRKQWNFLIAVAKEGRLSRLTSSAFLSRYEIGGATHARRMAGSLTEKELLLEIPGKNGISFRIYDVFFSRWLQHEY